MFVWFKRHMTGDAILMCVSIMMILTGCGADLGREFSGTESTEYNGVGIQESETFNSSENLNAVERSEISKSAANAEEDGIANRNSEAINSSENLNAIESSRSSGSAEGAGKEELEPQEPESIKEPNNFNAMEVYENFLEGKLTVEWKGQQVSISELFWDNDIEYCYFDIDGDGSEELHIRDNAAYYTVKAWDKMPQILFEGWVCYEPINTEKLCGILYYASYGIDEEIEFIQLQADGSQKSEGMFHWYDNNRNGAADEEDTFVGPGNIDVAQYIQYKEEHVMQVENDLEWTGRRLQDFATWQEAYAGFIQKISITVLTNDYSEYSLIYVDSDDIPELYIFSGSMAIGEILVSFYGGNVRSMNRGRVGIQYIERGGLLYSNNGVSGDYPCNIYRLEKGAFSEIGTGGYTEYDDEQGNICDDYFWEGKAVTEADYEANIDKLIDRSKCVTPSVLYSKDEILEMLMSEN